MFSFQRSNTPYMSIYPFNDKRFEDTLKPKPKPIHTISLKTPPRNNMVDKTNNIRKPGTRKPRVITNRISVESTAPKTSSSITKDNFTGFEKILSHAAIKRPAASTAPAASVASAASADSSKKGVQGFSHLFQ